MTPGLSERIIGQKLYATSQKLATIVEESKTEKVKGVLSPPSTNSEYERDFEPVPKDNKTTHMSATGEQTLPPKSFRGGSIISNKTEPFSESDHVLSPSP